MMDGSKRAFGFRLALALLVAIDVGAASSGAGVITASGIAVHYGITSATAVRQHPAGHPERKMHGGPPSSPDMQHLVVALFDGPGGARIDNAKVTATVRRGGHATERVLEPMQINSLASYGGYFSMPSPGDYRITLELDIPGRATSIRASFDYQRR